MELEKKYNIQDNFIGVFDNFFPEYIIEAYLKHFEVCHEQNLTYKREDTHLRKDTSMNFLGIEYEERFLPYNNEPFIELFYKQIFPIYCEKFDQFKTIERHSIFGMRLQKTKPSEGYHFWHYEYGIHNSRNRLFAFTLYLNDIIEGGETEFLYQKCRVKPIKNRFVLWPAAITHMHRGNPPLSNDKYILTGWVEYA